MQPPIDDGKLLKDARLTAAVMDVIARGEQTMNPAIAGNVRDCLSGMIAALSRPGADGEAVAQLGGAPDDLRNLIRVVFADFDIDQIAEVTRKVLDMRDPALAAPPAPVTEALRKARDAIASLPEDVLGMATGTVNGEMMHYPIRDELLDDIDAALGTATGTGDGESLDARMEAAGMIPLSKLLAGDVPIERFMAHTGVNDIESFGQWLHRKHEEFMRMKVAYALGDKNAFSDDLYEWVLAYAATFAEVVANWRKATAAPSPDAEG